MQPKWHEWARNLKGRTHSGQGLQALGRALFFAAWSVPAWASLPWEAPICTFANSMAGPVAHGVAMIAIVVTGLLMTFGEHGGAFKTGMRVLMGLSIALLASQWLGVISPGSLAGCMVS
ncbi:MAG: TrbC/VirB2 family protein [Pseudomonadota bacterium]|nr:TrbC/VirB2 family protein [Pseudomonadota bacterium]